MQPPTAADPHLPLPLDRRDASVPQQQQQQSTWLTVVTALGLPCIIGVAAIDPGNLEVDLQAGAALGYSLIWSLLLASILGWILQTLAAHATIYTNLHLAELCHRVYRRSPVLSRLVFGINMLSVIAFDVAEVIGTAVATRLLFGIPLWIGMILSVCDTLLVLLLQKNGMTRIEIIVEGLLFILAACLIYEFILAGPSWPHILQGALVPSFSGSKNLAEGVVLAISIMGSVIMSHNLFLHSWLEKERRNPHLSSPQRLNSNTDSSNSALSFVSQQHPDQQQVESSTNTPSSVSSVVSKLYRDCRYAMVESAAIFFSTFLINMCVLVVAATLPSALVDSLDGEIGLKDAGALLQRVLGQRFTSTVWGVALLASGHAATVTGVLASQAVCEGFLQVHERHTTSARAVVSPSHIILASRLIAILPALAVALIAGEAASDSLAVASQAVLSFSLPYAAIPLFKVLEAVATVRPLYSRTLLTAGYVVFTVVMVANVLAIREFAQVVSNWGLIPLAMFWIGTVALSVFLFKLIFTPVRAADISAEFGNSESSPDELSHLVTSK